MEPLDRRRFLGLSGSALGLAAVTAAAPASAAKEVAPSFDTAKAMLYDATKCIGCLACAKACREENKLKAERGRLGDVAFDMPSELNAENWMVLKAFRGGPAGPPPASRDLREAQTPETPRAQLPRNSAFAATPPPAPQARALPPNVPAPPSEWSFVKQHCMHCNQPACVSVCPVAALKKTPEGPVVYDESRCFGCRYCQLACPWGVPRYQWKDNTPRVRKCTLCMKCVDACPTGALVQGPRGDVLEDAHQRIAMEPARYVPHVYGEHEAGGTSYLMLSAVPFDKLGLPKISSTVRSTYTDAIMKGLPGWIIGMGLFLGGAFHLLRRKERPRTDGKPEGEGGAP